MPTTPPVVGLIVNPIAGLGGPLGLRGTDGEARARAVSLRARPIAGPRARRAITRLAERLPTVAVLAAGGVMGADHVDDLVVDPITEPEPPTTSEDTQRAAEVLVHQGVDLILFAGGDGTARDVAGVVGDAVPVLGVPTGVKMHSSVFAATPEAAGEIAARFLADPDRTPLRRREVLDVIAAGNGQDSLAPARILTCLVPYVRGRLQEAKAVSATDDDALVDAASAEIAAELDPGRTYVVGPGTTTLRVLAHLGIVGTATGVDIIRGPRHLATEADESTILQHVSAGSPTGLILGVIGGQGFLLGRGNQQISAEVIRHIDPRHVIIVASEPKLRALDPPELLVDTGVEEAEPVLLGYHRVRTGAGRSMMMRVAHPS